MRTDTHRGMTTWGHTAVHTPRRPRQEAARPHLELGLPAAGRVRWMFPVGSRCCRPRKWTETLPLPGSQGDFRKSKRSAAMLKAAQWLPRAAGGDKPWHGPRPPLAGFFLLPPCRSPGLLSPSGVATVLLPHTPGPFFSFPPSLPNTQVHAHSHTRTHTPPLLISPARPAGCQFKPHLSRPCGKPLFLLLPGAPSTSGAGSGVDGICRPHHRVSSTKVRPWHQSCPCAEDRRSDEPGIRHIQLTACCRLGRSLPVLLLQALE